MQCTTYWCMSYNIFKNYFLSERNKHVLIELFILSISVSCVTDLVTVVVYVPTVVHVTDTCDWCGADVTTCDCSQPHLLSEYVVSQSFIDMHGNIIITRYQPGIVAFIIKHHLALHYWYTTF